MTEEEIIKLQIRMAKELLEKPAWNNDGMKTYIKDLEAKLVNIQAEKELLK